MPLLILRCSVVGKVLFVDILHQDDAIKRGEVEFHSPTNSFSIRSYCVPELSRRVLFVRGTDHWADNTPAKYIFNTAAQAVESLSDLQVAVGELSQHFKATGNPPPPPVSPDGALIIVG